MRFLMDRLDVPNGLAISRKRRKPTCGQLILMRADWRRHRFVGLRRSG
jgi:hypothetical protein